MIKKGWDNFFTEIAFIKKLIIQEGYMSFIYRRITSGLLILFFLFAFIKPNSVTASPGLVTITGTIKFQPRNWNSTSQNYLLSQDLAIQLYQYTGGVPILIDSTNTDSFGKYTFASKPIQNLTIFLKVWTQYPVNTLIPENSVMDTHTNIFNFPSDNTYLPNTGQYTKDFTITDQWPGYEALWIFQDLRNTWHYFYNTYYKNGNPYDSGIANVIWEPGVNGYMGINSSYTTPVYIFIADNSKNSMDVVVHEDAHKVMINANGYWYVDSNCFQHSIPRASDFKCAWAEGWADFLPLVVNNDQCYNFGKDKCQGTADQDYYNLELHSRMDNWNDFNWGESVEGRVAGALYDLYDSNNEGMDRIFRGITPIANYALKNPPIQTFQDFWNLWKANEPDTFLSGLTLYWNTIMYININQIYLPRVNK